MTNKLDYDGGGSIALTRLRQDLDSTRYPVNQVQVITADLCEWFNTLDRHLPAAQTLPPRIDVSPLTSVHSENSHSSAAVYGTLPTQDSDITERLPDQDLDLDCALLGSTEVSSLYPEHFAQIFDVLQDVNEREINTEDQSDIHTGLSGPSSSLPSLACASLISGYSNCSMPSTGDPTDDSSPQYLSRIWTSATFEAIVEEATSASDSAII